VERIGWIGLGTLGSTMARRLRDQGLSLTVWNRTPGKVSALGLPAAATPRELVSRSELVVISLFGSNAVDRVLGGPDGILAGGLQGRIVVDTTTNHPRRVQEFHQRVAEAGGRYLEAPVLGSVLPATRGALIMLVSGPLAALEEARPILSLLASRIVHLPEAGRATALKLINNLLLAAFMGAIAEAAALAEAAGLPADTALEVLAAGAGNSALMEAKRTKLLTGDYSPHFSAALMHKDLGYLRELASRGDHPLLVGRLMEDLYGRALARGWGELDFSVVARLLAQGGEGSAVER
jgi:3-hydroxyisobutyrate dehydrogenase